MSVDVSNGQFLPPYRVAADILDGAQNQWIVSRPFATRIDEASTTVTYFGWAVPGTLDAAATWRIMRQTESGTVTLGEWADGNENFDNQWSLRETLNYS